MARCPEKESSSAGTRADTLAQSRTWLLALAAILLLALALRLVHITQESIWWDEFATVAFLDPPPSYEDSPHFNRWNEIVMRRSSPTLGDFLSQNKTLDPAAMPLYLALEYYWNRYVHSSHTALRLLSVLIGMAIFPVLFLLGRRLHGPPAALIALFCLALSPIHVQFAKEIRMYGLMTLLAVLAVYTYCRLLEGDGRRWWLLYAVSVLLLSWTHPFALLLPFVQGLFWLVAYPHDIVRLVKWGLLTALMTFPAALWILRIQFWGMESTELWLRTATVMELLSDIFADDAIGATYQTNATPHAFSWFVGDGAANWLLSWRWAVGRAMIAGAALSIGWLLFASRERPAGEAPAVKSAGVRVSPFMWSWFLTFWLVLPPLILYVLSLLWRPCQQPRYTVHASLALYLILGGAIMLLPRRGLRWLSVGCIVLFYGYQQMLMIGEPQHPDWLGAAATIRDEGHPDDLVLVDNWLWKRVFAYNMGPAPHVVCYASSYDILAEKAAFFLDLALPSRVSAGETRGVWVVVRTDYFTQGTIAALEQEFSLRGLSWDVYEFGGIQRVILYQVMTMERTPPYRPIPALDAEAPREFADLAMEFWRIQEYDTAVLAAGNAIRINPEYPRSWSYLGMAHKELGREEEALKAFAQAIKIDPMDYPWSLNNYAELLIRAGRYEEGAMAARQVLDVLPGDPWSMALLGWAYHGLGEYGQARDILREATSADPGDMRIQQWLDSVEEAMTGEVHH